MLFSCWNETGNEDESFGFDSIPLENPHAPERVTTTFTDHRHVCVYVNGYYAYTLCARPENPTEEVNDLFMTNSLPPKSTAMKELEHLMVCRCDDDRAKCRAIEKVH